METYFHEIVIYEGDIETGFDEGKLVIEDFYFNWS